MSVGRYRQLALPASGQRAVAREYAAYERADQPQQVAPLPRAEMAALPGEACDQGIGPPNVLAEPRQVVPHGEVVDERVGRVGDALGRTECLGDTRELEIGREALHHL